MWSSVYVSAAGGFAAERRRLQQISIVLQAPALGRKCG